MPNSVDIDVSALAEALNEKMDRDLDNKAVNVHYIVETWHSGTEWYRVWSDGWIEQGGDVPVALSSTSHTLNKSFSDTNYTIEMTYRGIRSGDGNSNSSAPICVTPYTNTAFTYRIDAGATNYGGSWYACGF